MCECAKYVMTLLIEAMMIVFGWRMQQQAVVSKLTVMGEEFSEQCRGGRDDHRALLGQTAQHVSYQLHLHRAKQGTDFVVSLLTFSSTWLALDLHQSCF